MWGSMLLNDYRPRPKLVTKTTYVTRPRFPVIDAHNHLNDEFGHGWIHRPVEELLAALDEAGVTALVDLDGGWGEQILYEHLDHLMPAGSDRFLVFGGVDWQAWPEHGNRFGEWAAGRLRIQAQRGAAGLKIWKPFGLHVRDQGGRLVSVDDERLDALWETAGELHLPVTIHIADPAAFFDPLDEHNERWEELSANPSWQFPSPPFPAFLDILNAFANLIERHPRTTFIGAHVGNYAENLGWVADLLERCPNFNIDISARIGELGRQPYTARRFFNQYADRILFGLDTGAEVEGYRLTYRFLETDDEYFSYDGNEVPGQGRWYVYGLDLPDDTLEKVYHLNAKRLLFSK